MAIMKIKNAAGEWEDLVSDSLEDNSPSKALSAKQGKILDESKADKSDTYTKTEVNSLSNGKIDKPTSSTPAGKFMQTDDHGNAIWGDGASGAEVGRVVTTWLEENISGGQTIAIDTSLSVPGAAAESATVGNLLDEIIQVADEEPTDEFNKIWVEETPDSEIEIPDYEDFENLVTVSSDEPTAPANKVWIKPSGLGEVAVTTYEEFTGVIAPDYDTINVAGSMPIKVGQHCIHSGEYYSCIVEITEPETFTLSHWTKMTVGSEASDLKSAINVLDAYKLDKITSETALSGETKGGKLFNFSTKAFDDIGSPAKAIVISSGFTGDQKIYIDGWTFSHNSYKTVVFLDANSNILASYRGTSTSAEYDLTCEIPLGTTQIIINGRNDIGSAKLIVPTNYDFEDAKADIDQAKADIIQNKSNIVVLDADSNALDSYKLEKINTESLLSGTTQSDKLYNSSTKSFDDIGSPAKAIVITSGFSANQKVKVDGWTFTSSVYKTVVFLDSSDNILSYYRGTTTGAAYVVVCSIPEGTSKIIINGRENDATATLFIPDDTYDFADAKEDIDTLKATAAHKFPKYEEISATIQTGKMLNVKTFNGSDAEIERSKYIILTEGFEDGDTVAITGKNGGNATYGAVGFWSDSAVLGYDSTPLNTVVSRKILTVPDGTTQIRVNGGTSVTPKIEKVTYYDLQTLDEDMSEQFEETDESIDMRMFDISNAFDRIIAKQKQSPFVFKPFDKPIISFVFDDSLSDISLIESIFEENNIPCGFATIPNYLNRATLDGRTVKAVLQDAEANGGEVLCHSNTTMTEDSTDQQVWQNFVGNKKALVDAGFTVTGIILTGGTGLNTFDWKRCERYLRCYYDFSDRYGKDLGMPNFYTNNRKWMTSTLADNKAYIDDAIANNNWIILSAHGVTEPDDPTDVTQQTLEDTIAYILTKDVYVYTPRQVIEKYGGCEATRIED